MSDQSSAVNKTQSIDEAGSQSAGEKDQQKAAQEFSRSEVGGKLVMNVKVYSPFRDYYDGQAFSISAVNATGPFDILPKHHNFISLLSPCELDIRTAAGEEQKIRIGGGMMHVKADRVLVFLDV